MFKLILSTGVLHYFGVIAEDGETLFLWGISNALETMKYLTPEGMKQLSESREPIEVESVKILKLSSTSFTAMKVRLQIVT